MDILREAHDRLLEKFDHVYVRDFYRQFRFLYRVMGIIGARGVGKTTFLLHYLKENYGHSEKALYVSADHLYFSQNTLLEVVDRFHKEHAGELLCIDEIHRYSNWNQELKNIIDSYPSMKIIFSGSSSINLIKGKYDLSRRAILRHLSGFSFREFLEIRLNQSFPILKLNDLLKSPSTAISPINSTPKLLGWFKKYLKTGYYPLFLEISDEGAYYQAILSTVEKTIYEDLASFYAVKTQHLGVFRKLLTFLATSAPGSMNINKLGKSLRKDHSTISAYLEMMRDTGLIRFLLKDKRGHALVRNAEKMYLANTNLLQAITHSLGKQTDLGALRELFVISQLEEAGHPVFYADPGDICSEGKVFEIGGKGKKWEQLKRSPHHYLIRDDALTAQQQVIPLYAFGFLR
jgi:predicted AAA+ superfamily ATPase